MSEKLWGFKHLDIDGKILYKPQPKQKTFHNAIINRRENGYRDFLYGGSARSGKSYSMRWEAHRNCLHYNGIRGLLIRSSFPELYRTHLSKIIFDLPSKVGTYNDKTHSFKYFNRSVLEFGYGASVDDFKQYLSAEYDFIMIDELTTIPFELSYKLRSRLTASRKDFIPFWACGTNPGDVAHEQVKAYFITKNVDKEDYPLYNPDEVFFIPALVYDNQELIEKDPDVIKRLKQMNFRDQQKYLYGSWDIYEGQFFDEFSNEVHVVKPQNYLRYEQLMQFSCLAGMDYGNETYVYWLAVDWNDNVIVFDEFESIKEPRTVKIERLRNFIAERGLQKIRIVADTNMWLPDGFDVEYSSVPANDFIENGVMLTKVSKNSPDNRRYRVACNDTVRDYLHHETKDGVTTKQPKVKIYQRCKKLISTLPALITDPKDAEDIKDGQFDHCFVAGTKIITLEGKKNIEDIKIGDFALTRNGFKKVVLTHKVENQIVNQYFFDNGTDIICTLNHKIFTSKGFLEINKITPYLNVSTIKIKEYLLWKILSLLSLMVSNSDVIQIPKTQATPDITGVIQTTSKTASDTYITKFINSIMAKYRMVATSITRTAIITITVPKILLLLMFASICPNTQKSIVQRIKSALKSTWKTLDRSQKNGTQAKKAGNGIANKQRKHSPMISDCENAIGAEANTKRKRLNQDSALQNACRNISIVRQGMLSMFVKTAVKLLLAINIKNLNSVRHPVHLKTTGQKRKATVYDLTVEDAHEYYANGILVHNCYDAFKMSLLAIWSKKARVVEQTQLRRHGHDYGRSEIGETITSNLTTF